MEGGASAPLLCIYLFNVIMTEIYFIRTHISKGSGCDSRLYFKKGVRRLSEVNLKSICIVCSEFIGSEIPEL
jgi:hypothetical protein